MRSRASRQWRTHTAHAAVVSALVLGIQNTLRRRETVAIVVDHRRHEPPSDGMTLFFHPEVPEATLLLVQ